MNLYKHIKQLKMYVSIINNYIHEAVVNRYAQLRGGYLVPFLPFRTEVPDHKELTDQVIKNIEQDRNPPNVEPRG